MFKAGAASAQLADASGVTADGNRAAFHAGIAVSERVAATSQPNYSGGDRSSASSSSLFST